MDPNEALRQLRAYAAALRLEWEGKSEPLNRWVPSWVEKFEALDEWLTDGGFLPDDWAGLSQIRQSDIERLQREKTDNL